MRWGTFVRPRGNMLGLRKKGIFKDSDNLQNEKSNANMTIGRVSAIFCLFPDFQPVHHRAL